MIKKEYVAWLFLAVVAASFFIHASNRQNHFQECDSSGVYEKLQNFPEESYFFTRSDLSHRMAQKLAPTFLGKYLVEDTRDPVRPLPNTPYATPPVANSSFVEFKPFNAVRIGLIDAVENLSLPFAAQSFFALSLATTYSPGPGFLYGLMAEGPYESFMSQATLLTILIFHLSVVLVFLALRTLAVRADMAALAGFLMLFSVSHYSYGYHLGSTVWNIATASFWFWWLAASSKRADPAARVAWMSAVLAFFNYLIVFYWAGFVLIAAWNHVRENRSWKERVKQSVSFMVKTQWPALLAFFIVVLAFFPPGQGNRGSAGAYTWAGDFYYLILNFFAFTTHASLLPLIQFILGVFLVAAAAWALRSRKPDETKGGMMFRQTASAVLMLFAAAVLFRILGLAPSRHILFLSPLIFILVGMGLHRILAPHLSRRAGVIVLGAVIVLGFVAVGVRLADAVDRTASVPNDPGITQVIVSDCSWDLAYRDWNSQAETMFINSPLLRLEKGNTYRYISQTVPFEAARAELMTKLSPRTKLQVLSATFEPSTVFFTAYNPDFARFPHNRPNSLYTAVFAVEAAP